MEFVERDRREADPVLLKAIMNQVRLHVPHLSNRNYIEDPEDLSNFNDILEGCDLNPDFDISLP